MKKRFKYIKFWGWVIVPRISKDLKNIFMVADTWDFSHKGVSKLGTGPGMKSNSQPNLFMGTSIEFRKCIENPYYFATTYLKVDGKPFTTWLSEKNFNDMIFKFAYKKKEEET